MRDGEEEREGWGGEEGGMERRRGRDGEEREGWGGGTTSSHGMFLVTKIRI